MLLALNSVTYGTTLDLTIPID
ncbi:hypothetical protein SBF1_930005 [Candidatus Desulfosporosinus infrequens]|uniref:Uncharacterized protein n=1 Tax=Candidatus Desulfosporosinus infrequens TaxID=2043169 RepID=A0A2U3LXC4_9FIRM|nr:hypothetical protein SBF1_930005 [Candidatus Desulfosporosinus infrequens]